MFEAAMNLLLMVLMAAVTALWIAALAESDGKCHEEDCGGCPFEGNCPMEKEKDERYEDC